MLSPQRPRAKPPTPPPPAPQKEVPIERCCRFLGTLAKHLPPGSPASTAVLEALVQHLASRLQAADKVVRFRACQLLANVLQSLHQDAELSQVRQGGAGLGWVTRAEPGSRAGCRGRGRRSGVACRHLPPPHAPSPPPPHPPRQTLLDEVADQLIGRLEDKVTGVRAQAARALGRLCAPDEDGAYSQDPAAAALMGLLEDEAVKASSGSPGRGGAHEPAGSRSGQGKQW